MEELYLPVLSHFQNGNVWTGSGGNLRYQLTPGEETISAQVWQGPWAYADSTVEETRDFSLTEEGLDALRDWLTDWTAQMGQRAKKTLAETLQARDALRAREGAAE